MLCEVGSTPAGIKRTSATVGEVLATDVGDGVIDNIIIGSAVHRW
jgi:hypothetical protein